MADNTTMKNASGAPVAIATDDVGGVQHQLVKVEFGADGAALPVSSENPLPVALDGAATTEKQDAILAALADVSAALSAVASAVQATLEVAGVVSVSNLPATQPVSGSVSVSNFPATQPVSGPLTDAQLRATEVPVSVAALPLASGAATQATLADVLSALQSALSVTFPSAQSVSISGTPTVALGNITNQTYAETTTALGANATFTGSSRSAGSTTAYSRFIARALADQSGTFYVDYSPNNSTWYTHSSVAVTANAVAELVCNVVTQYHRVRFVNGATAQGSLAIQSALVKV